MKIGRIKFKKEAVWKIILIVSSVLLILSSFAPLLFL